MIQLCKILHFELSCEITTQDSLPADKSVTKFVNNKRPR